MNRVARVTLCVMVTAGALLCAATGAGAAGSPLQIAFQTDRDGFDSELWMVGADGSGERPLTRNSTPDASPSWSPDASTIVYACALDGNWDVCTIDPASGDVTQLTRTGVDEFDPRYTADGLQIVMETYAGDNADIAIMPARGGLPSALTSTRTVDDQDPAPDPAGDRIAFARGPSIVTLETAMPKSVTRVTSGSRGDSDAAFSSRDEIAFTSRRGDSLDILVAGPASSGRALRRLTTGGGADSLEPAWTADGAEVYFARERAGSGYRIFAMDGDGRDRRAITAGGDYNDTEPAPQPATSGGLPAHAASASEPVVDAGPLGQMWGVVAVAASACIDGNNANDSLKGTANNDCMHGKGGNDRLTGKAGRDKLYGDGDDDIFKLIDGEKDYCSGGGGTNQSYRDTSPKDVCVNAPAH